MSIQKDTIIRRSDDVFAGQIDDELVMVSIISGSYFVLNPVARSIWELIESPLTLNEICDKLIEEYEIAPPTCQREVVVFVERLLEKQIIIVS